MKHKVKKFGRGGDILTALGAGLAGYGAYKYFTKDKDKDKDDDYTRRVKEFGRKGDFPEAQKEEKAEAKVADDRDEARDAARERALRQSKGRPEMGGGDKSVMYSDKTAETTPRKTTSTTPRKIVLKKAPSRPAASTSTSKSFTPPADNAALKSKPYPAAVKPSEGRPSKPYPEKEAEANKVKNIPGVTVMKPSDKEIRDIKAKQAAAARAKKGQGLTPYASSRREEIMRNNRFHREAELGRGIKKGGVIKKYADGGTTSSKPAPKKAPMPAFAREAKENRERDQRVKKEREEFDKGAPTRLKDQGSFKKGGMTASKRADGIAIRGKTRA
jgi:hypothetical protein